MTKPRKQSNLSNPRKLGKLRTLREPGEHIENKITINKLTRDRTCRSHESVFSHLLQHSVAVVVADDGLAPLLHFLPKDLRRRGRVSLVQVRDAVGRDEHHLCPKHARRKGRKTKMDGGGNGGGGCSGGVGEKRGEGVSGCAETACVRRRKHAVYKQPDLL